jgi:hypothetical protein
MKNVLVLIFSITFLCISSQSLMAEDPPKTDAVDSKKTDVEKIVEQTPSAITLGIVDGIIRYIKNERRVKIKLQWEPLAQTISLQERANNSDFEVTTIKISNEDIKNGDWARNLDKEEIRKLGEALNNPNLKNLTFNNIDLKDLNRGLKVSDYIRMQRERNILKTLLLSKGVQYSFGFKSKENPIVVPDYSDKNITWKINIYSFQKNKEGLTSYRFTAKAVVEPFEERILEDFIDPSGNKESVFYDVRFKLKESDRISSIANNLFFLPASFELPTKPTDETPATKMTEQTVNKALTSLSGFFSFFGSPEQFGAAVQGILGGTENTSIVSGGLVNFKDGGVSPLIGINQEVGQLGDDISGGILLGVGLGEKTSLFLGPSIRSSIFTLSAGATLGTQASSEINYGGMIAIDLSRLTNSKKDPSPIKVTGSSKGGGLGQIGDEVIDKYDKYTVVEYESNRIISMTRICDENSAPIPDKLKKSEEFKIANSKTRKYVIRGIYEYKSANREETYYPNFISDKLNQLDKPISSDGKGATKRPCTEAKDSTSDKPSM